MSRREYVTGAMRNRERGYPGICRCASPQSRHFTVLLCNTADRIDACRWRAWLAGRRMLPDAYPFLAAHASRVESTREIAEGQRTERLGAAGHMGVRLEDVTPGALVGGIAGDSTLTVVAVQWIGSNALQLTYRTAEGRLDERLLYRDHEPRLTLVEAAAAYDFSADATHVQAGC